MADPHDLRALAGPALTAAGLQLWDVEVAGDALRFFVERDGGVDLDVLSVASAALSELLDAHDELVPGDAYHLEVSSPGLERTLRTPEQFGRYVGTTVNVKTTAPVNGGRRHRGVLVAVDDQGVTLAPDASPGQPVEVPYALIERARTVLEWGPTPKPGRAPRSTTTAEPVAPQSSTAEPVAAGRDAANAAPARDTNKDPLR